MMEIILEDLTKKMEALFDKVNAIEKKLRLENNTKGAELVSELPLNDLVMFKIELEEVRRSLKLLNQQANNITIFEMLKRIESTTNEIKESSGFMKNIFVREKPKPVKEKVSKQDSVNVYLKKYMKSMR